MIKTSGGFTILLLILIVAIFADQTRFLYTYPVPDTGMWFGDESWTMLTVRALAHSGVARVPEALGSSLSHSNGLINGSIWLSGLIYGAPAVWFSALATPVAVGRTITLVIALLSCVVVFRLLRRIGASSGNSCIALLALIASDAFFFSSHSARLDVITGFAILLYLFLTLRIFNSANTSPSSFFLFGFIIVASLTIYVHVPTLIALPALYSAYKFGALRKWQNTVATASGAVAAVVIIVLAYWLSTGSFDLLGKGYNQYYNVANSLPVLHPFSWQVQKINTIDRAIQVWDVAWPVVLLIVIGVALRLWKRTPFTKLELFILINVFLIVVSWMLFEGPAVFYNIHVLPVLAVAGGILVAPAFGKPLPKTTSWSLGIAFTAFAIVTIITGNDRAEVGKRLVSSNERAIHTLVGPIASFASPPIVLTDEPAENEIAGMRGVRLMTNHLLLFGEENRPLAEILNEKRVDYLLLYSTDRWHSPFRQIADSLYEFEGEQIGTLTDQARTYSEPRWNELDTLRLYKAK